MQIMETRERKSRLIRTSCEFANYSETDNGRKYSIEKDMTKIESAEGKDLESLGISIVDTDAKNFSDVTPEETSDFYKSLGEWHNVLPKTDYTYSPLSRYYTKKINGNIPIIPNMSRRQIWRAQSEEEEENDVNTYLKRNYDYEKLLKKSSVMRTRTVETVSRVVKTFYRSVHGMSRSYGEDSTRSTVTDKLVLTVLAVLAAFLLYFLLPEFSVADVVRAPFIVSFRLVKYLVFNSYELTCCSITFIMSLISVFFSNVSYAANTIVVAPMLHRRPDPESKPETGVRDGVDIENALKHWLNENSASIAKTVVDNEDFVKFIDDKLRQSELDERIRFEKFLQSYDFHSSPFGEKLKSMEVEMARWRAEDEKLKDSVNKLRDEVKTKDVEIKKEIIILLASVFGANQSADDLKEKFASLFELVKSAHLRIDNLAGEFYSYRSNNSENLNMTERLREELIYNFKISIDETVASQMQEWRDSRPPETVTIDRIEVIEKYVDDVVRRALEIYDADKTGKADFALESQGGSILSIRCTETKPLNARVYILGVPLWYASTSPRTVIQPGAHPGECWAFWGSSGFLVIRLSQKILITGFSLEHESRALAANGRIESAPKDFSVWALRWELDSEPKFLGEFVYSDEGPSVQYFEAVRLDEGYQIVELKILSNHGKQEYTCLYRFRVHGIPA